VSSYELCVAIVLVAAVVFDVINAAKSSQVRRCGVLVLCCALDFVSLRFVSFRFVSFRFVSLRFSKCAAARRCSCMEENVSLGPRSCGLTCFAPMHSWTLLPSST